ncbi:hypothetical protein ABZ958_34725 [Streptomyces sp. NPDC046237]|uniref:hypothetical protein n=1 Tax=Streptomyces sp. NPDC046237 TaxID=3154914 RepID=UPI0033F412E0
MAGHGGTKDGRHVIALNFNGDWIGGGKNVVSAEFCMPRTAVSPPSLSPPSTAIPHIPGVAR